MNESQALDPLAQYRRRARRSVFHYLLLAVGLSFASTILFIDPARHCVEGPCPLWLRGLASGLGLLFALGAASALWRDWEWGSRIEDASLVWWVGAPPAEERKIAASAVATIVVDSSSDTEQLRFLDEEGKKIPVPGECLRGPAEQWAEAFARRFPHISIERR